MNIIVTGGAGFIGSNFVYFLLKNRKEWNITVIDDLTYAGNLENIAKLIDDNKIKFIKANIVDGKKIDECFEALKPDYVVNFAAETHVDRSILSAAEFVSTNVLGTQVLLNASMAHGAKRYVQISTDEVYGALGKEGSFYEHTPLNPTSPYSASKAGADFLVNAFFKTYSLDVCITRCTNNYGPYQFPEKLIPLFLTNALDDKDLPLYGDGMNVRSWIYVDDHLDAILKVLENGRAGEVYNIGGSVEAEIPNKIVAEKILKIIGKPTSLIKYVKDRVGHDFRYSVDCTKIKNELGWEPKINFEDGLQKTINWYLENENWWKKVKSAEYQAYYELNYKDRFEK
ncbi:MAG: dTDP-glucose 4,6-dehydratase [Bdellovibrionota bacterium]